MLLIYVCENNIEQLKLYEEYINKSLLFKDYNIKFEYSTPNPYDLLDHIDKMPERDIGLYFLDIDLKCATMNGLKLSDEIRKIDPRGFIVFITARIEMSFIVLQHGVEALDFILKDLTETIRTRMEQDIDKAYERYKRLGFKWSNSICIKSGNREIILNAEDILYVDSSVKPHRLMIHTKNEVLSIYGGLRELLHRLPENFCRCHKSFILNVDYISEFNSTDREIKIVNGDVCPMSMQYMKKIKEVINRNFL